MYSPFPYPRPTVIKWSSILEIIHLSLTNKSFAREHQLKRSVRKADGLVKCANLTFKVLWSF